MAEFNVELLAHFRCINGERWSGKKRCTLPFVPFRGLELSFNEAVVEFTCGLISWDGRAFLIIGDPESTLGGHGYFSDEVEFREVIASVKAAEFY